MAMPPSKACTKCGVVKSLEDFSRAKQAPGGIRSVCRECANAKLREWKKANPEKVRASKRRYDEANRERVAERKRRYAEENRERLAEYHRQYREANLERTLVYVREWRKRNRDKQREYGNRRRAAIAGTSVGPIDLEALWTGDCPLCGSPIDRSLAYPDPMSKSVDHIIPISRGGGHVQENLQLVHLVCNLRKRADVASEEAS